MNITLLDPGLSSPRGHHFDLDLRLVRALGRLGHDVVVHGSIKLDPRLLEMANASGMAIHPTFCVHTYASLPPPLPPLQAYAQIVNATAADLGNVPHSDLWIWPTMAPYQFAAALSQGNAVRQLGGMWWTPRIPHGIGSSSWARSSRRVVQEDLPITVGAYDQALCRAYQSFSPELEVACLPCPHDGAANELRPSKLRRIGFFGHQRDTRGLTLLPHLVMALIQRGYDVVVQDSSGSIKGKHPSVQVLQFVEDFAAEIARCDLVIWPSRWEAYMESCSGVMSECIATGVPIIAPSGCLPAEVLVRFGCGIFFHEFSVDAIMEALDQAEPEFAEHVSRARQAAVRWHAGNGTDRLASWIDAHARAQS